MYALDFEYDGRKLSDMGFIICDFNSPSGADTISAGSTIAFNTTAQHSGKRFGLSSTKYDECIEATFHICKHPDISEDMVITDMEYRALMRWLNRREFLRFHIIEDDEFSRACYYDASFNISRIEINKKLYGLELQMVTNRPFGYGKEVRYAHKITNVPMDIKVIDISDEMGYTYPDLTILCAADGDFEICNNTLDCTMAIKNCKVGEKIEIAGGSQIIQTSRGDHAIYNDFNFQFLRIGNSPCNNENILTINMPCDLEIRYAPIIKGAP